MIEDDARLAGMVAEYLGGAGVRVSVAADGRSGLARLAGEPFDALVLDLMLPRRSGWDVLDALRAAGRRTPVLLLTARDAVDDRVRGLNAGADDYLTKPFALEELVARLRALIRRAAAQPAPSVRIADVDIDLASRRVFRGGTEVALTAREFGILELLVRERGAVVGRSTIAEHLYADDQEFLSNAIDVHVAALRRKLGAHLIRTRRGLGYLIDV